MKRNYRIYLILIAIIAPILFVGAVSFLNALSWVGQPFQGFLIYKLPYAASLGNPNWTGPQAGIKLMDRILSFNDKPVRKGKEVVDLARKMPPGTPVHYSVESKGQIRQVTVPTELFTFMDFFLIFFLPFLCGLLILAIGTIVCLLKPGASSSWVFFFFCLIVSLYMVTGFEIQTTYFFVYLHYFFVPFQGAMVFHLGIIFPEPRKWVSRLPKIKYLIYLPAIVLGLLFEIHNLTDVSWLTPLRENIPPLRTISALTRIVILFGVIGFMASVLLSYYKASSNVVKQRAKMIFFGVTLAFLPTLMVFLFVHFVKLNFPINLTIYFILSFPASMAYAIIRHNLFDADTIIRRTVGYAVVTAIIIGAYVLVSISFNVLLGKYEIAQSKVFPIVFTLVIILIFNPLRNRIQSLVDRLFFRKEYDYGEIVDKISGAMTSLLEMPLILKRLVQTFMEDMFINTSSVMLLAPARTEFRVFLAEGEQKQIVEKVAFKQDNPLMEIIQKEKRELTKYDVLEDPRYRSVSESCAADFALLNASLIVPLVYQDQVIGSLNLGEKKSGKAYSREDIDLLRTIASQGSVAIENARLFQENLEKQRMEEELNIARDLQMSMLPATCPQVPGFSIAAASIPAREVGGDFFDFIEIREGKLGLVVGDVTGKSVSGALVMAASRSIFRMLSEEQLTVDEIMKRANRRTKKDIKSGMFVALLYAVLESKEKTLNLCSAGQTQPIHFSPETGQARLMETEGDRFPLGILDGADYRETRVELTSGDKIVFYTDGIVEAMNEKEEIFGFERLLEVVQGAPAMNAESLLKEILNNVNAFSGSAPQHDDLTVIVVAVE